MFDHIGLGVTNYAASKAFFLQSLQPLEMGLVMEGEHGIGIGPKGKPSLWLYQSSEKPTPLHLAFTAENRQRVRDFHRAALAAGGKDNGAPGLRPTTTPTTTARSSLGRTVTTSKRSVIGPRPEPPGDSTTRSYCEKSGMSCRSGSYRPCQYPGLRL